MNRTYVTISVVAENLEDRLSALAALEGRFVVTALPDHSNALITNPTMQTLGSILDRQKEDLQRKKAELTGAIYRVILQPSSPLQLLLQARQLGLMEADQMLLHKIQKDISDEVILIEPALMSEEIKAISQLADARFGNHLHRTSSPKSEGILDQVEASLAHIGGWGLGY